MTQNNLNVLSWYTDIDFQNHRKWWVDRPFCLTFPTGELPNFQFCLYGNPTIERFELWDFKTQLIVQDLTSQTNVDCSAISVNDDYILVKNNQSVVSSAANGQYFLVIEVDKNIYVSDVFSWNSVQGDVAVEYWNENDNLIYLPDVGAMDYSFAFKHKIYLKSEIAKPEYKEDVDVIKRDGYLFPIRSISYKLHKFVAWLPENIIDAMRIIAQHDHVKISWRGRTYTAIEFKMNSPKWEKKGDLASVLFEFKTDSVISTASGTGAGVGTGTGVGGAGTSTDGSSVIYPPYSNSEAAQNDTNLPIYAFYVLNDSNEQGVKGQLFQKQPN